MAVTIVGSLSTKPGSTIPGMAVPGGLPINPAQLNSAGSTDTLIIERDSIFADTSTNTDSIAVVVTRQPFLQDSSGSSDTVATAGIWSSIDLDDAGSSDSFTFESTHIFPNFSGDAGSADYIALEMDIYVSDTSTSSDSLAGVSTVVTADDCGSADSFHTEFYASFSDTSTFQDSLLNEQNRSITDSAGSTDSRIVLVAESFDPIESAGSTDSLIAKQDRGFLDSSGSVDSMIVASDSRTAIGLKEISRYGIPSGSGTSGDTYAGHRVYNDGLVVLSVDNTSGSTATMYFNIPIIEDGQKFIPPPIIVNVPAHVSQFKVGPFPPTAYSANLTFQVTSSALMISAYHLSSLNA